MGSVKTEKGGVCHVNPTCVLVLHCGEDLSCLFRRHRYIFLYAMIHSPPIKSHSLYDSNHIILYLYDFFHILIYLYFKFSYLSLDIKN